MSEAEIGVVTLVHLAPGVGSSPRRIHSIGVSAGTVAGLEPIPVLAPSPRLDQALEPRGWPSAIKSRRPRSGLRRLVASVVASRTAALARPADDPGPTDRHMRSIGDPIQVSLLASPFPRSPVPPAIPRSGHCRSRPPCRRTYVQAAHTSTSDFGVVDNAGRRFRTVDHGRNGAVINDAPTVN